MLQPRVTDLSHHNTITDLRAAAGAGLWGVINKATQGTTYRDPSYAQRRSQVLDAGMLWAAYHFGDSSDPVQQAAYFLSYARPDATTMLCLDYEDHPKGHTYTMKPQQMVAFLREIERRTGRRATLYGGNRIKEDIGSLSTADRAYVCSHPLWLCQYGSKPQLPQGFTRSFLWQYTDGRVGPQPHGVPGITGEVDLNAYNGTREQFEAAWRGPVQPDTDLSSQSRRGMTDADQDAQQDAEEDSHKTARGDTDGLPPFMQPDVQHPQTGGLNVQPDRAVYSLETEMLQTKLVKMDYHEIGDPDGKWGGKTRGAVTAFMNDRGRSPDGLTNDAGFVNPDARAVVTSEISRAVSDGWSRPIAPSRANAQPKEVATKVEAVKVSLWGRFSAKVGAGLAALGLGGSGLSDTFQAVKYKLQPIQDGFNAVPGTVWFMLMLVVAGGVWYFTDRAAKAATKDYNTGRLN